ncbi:MAG TPA: hypothetical protein VK453_13565 [Micromonosporaceae bacterium]|nr:hypothetical protein [Micromonosporaceae bacterium]
MTGDFLAPPRGSTRRRLLVIAIVVALLVVGVVAVRVAGDDSATGADDAPVTVTDRAAPTGAASPAPGVTEVAGEPLRLVAGATTVDGVRVGYPRSTVGAVSAAIEFCTQLGSTLEPDRARRIGARVAVRSWKGAAEDLGQGPVNTRRRLGLPVNGAVPPGASISLGPVAYQVRDAKADSMTVLVLAYMITTTPTEGTVSRLGVFPAPLRWDDDDWRIYAVDDGTDYRSLQAPPGSAQARAAGWLDFQQ